MQNRIFASATLALACAAAMVGCANDHSARTDNSGNYARTNNATNNRCPMCGMNADSTYTAWQNDQAVNTCSQHCADKFNSASDADKQRWMNKASRSNSSTATWNDQDITTYEARNDNTSTWSTVPAEAHAVRRDSGELNRRCPITGKSASDRYTFVDADGTRIAFSSKEAADQYMSYGPEHRAEVRSSMRQ